MVLGEDLVALCTSAGSLLEEVKQSWSTSVREGRRCAVVKQDAKVPLLSSRLHASLALEASSEQAATSPVSPTAAPKPASTTRPEERPASDAVDRRPACGSEAAKGAADRLPGPIKVGPVMLAIAAVICGCCSQAPYEVLSSRDRGCGDLMSLGEYVYGSIASAPAAFRARRERGGWQLPWYLHVGLAATGLGYGMLLNMAVDTPLPMPILITMKNGNLVANLIVSSAFFQARYNARQVASVLFVTVGLVVTALAGRPAKADDGDGGFTREALAGVVLLVAALLVRALGGAFQEAALKRCTGGTPVAEMLLCRSLLGLPLSLLRADAISRQWRRWQEPEVAGLVWPTVWVLLLGNLVFNYFIKVLMTRLIGETGTLTASMVLTLQRFVSFALFAVVLNPSPGETSTGVWLGSITVLLGSLAYSASSAEPSSKPAGAAKAA